MYDISWKNCIASTVLLSTVYHADYLFSRISIIINNNTVEKSGKRIIMKVSAKNETERALFILNI